MEICDINNRDFKIKVLKILNELWENTNRQFWALGKQINEQNAYFIEEIETLEKNQSEIQEMKHAIKEIKSEQRKQNQPDGVKD